jgi:hypothetical protein
MVLCNPLKSDANAGQCVDPLESWVGAPIGEICPFEYGAKGGAGAGENHCAHFVGHALGTVAGSGARCTELGDWKKIDRPLIKDIEAAVEPSGVPFRKLSKSDQKARLNEAKQRRGALTRVNELYALCANRAQVLSAADDKRLSPTAAGESLVFAALPVTFAKDLSTMGTQRKKHVGIVHRGVVFHYSTAHGQVLKDSFADFIKRFQKAYGGSVMFVVTDLP